MSKLFYLDANMFLVYVLQQFQIELLDLLRFVAGFQKQIENMALSFVNITLKKKSLIQRNALI